MAPVAMACVAIGGEWLAVNRSCRTMLGYSRDELLSTRIQDMLHDGGRTADGGLLRLSRRDGSVLQAHVRRTVANDGEGAPLYEMLVLEEVQRAVPAARISTAGLAWTFGVATLVAAVGLAYFLTQPDGAGIARIAPFVIMGVIIAGLGFQLRTALRRAEGAATRLRDESEANAAALQELRSARAEAERARGAAERASKAKSQFLANMSHELRTPLNAIAGHVQLLEMGLYGPITREQRESLDRVVRSQRHLLELIDDLLNFAKIETGKVEYHIQVVDLATLIADVRPLIETQMGAGELAYVVRPPPPDAHVWADPDKLRQVLLNLLSNAVKFTPKGGRVTVDVRTSTKTPGVLYLRVSDTGIGIPRDKQKTVFQPFVQVRNGFSTSTAGTGLGLAISLDFARGMGGDLRVRSEVGKGTTFTVLLRGVTADEERNARIV